MTPKSTSIFHYLPRLIKTLSIKSKAYIYKMPCLKKIPTCRIADMEAAACDLLHIPRNLNQEKLERKMKACFGCSVVICMYLWNYLRVDFLLPEKSTYKHLLWALAFLKTGSTEDQLSVWFECDLKTLRKWVWDMVLALSRYEAVSRKNYF